MIVTTAGGIEEDLIKCLAHTYLGDFSLPGKELRERGINRSATSDSVHLLHSHPQRDKDDDNGVPTRHDDDGA